jgi:hypothetical protein
MYWEHTPHCSSALGSWWVSSIAETREYRGVRKSGMIQAEVTRNKGAYVHRNIDE